MVTYHYFCLTVLLIIVLAVCVVPLILLAFSPTYRRKLYRAYLSGEAAKSIETVYEFPLYAKYSQIVEFVMLPTEIAPLSAYVSEPRKNLPPKNYLKKGTKPQKGYARTKPYRKK